MSSSSGSSKREGSLPESLNIMAGALPSCVGNSLGTSPFCVSDSSTGGCGVVNPLPGGGCDAGNAAIGVCCCTGNATRGVVVFSGDLLTIVKCPKLFFLQRLIYAPRKTRHRATSHHCNVSIKFCDWMMLWDAFATHLRAPLYIVPTIWNRQDIICQGRGDQEGQKCSRCHQSKMGGGERHGC